MLNSNHSNDFYNEVPSRRDISDYIAEDVLHAVSPGSYGTHLILKTQLAQTIALAIKEDGYEDKYKQAYGNAFDKQDIINNGYRFHRDSNTLPYGINPEVVSHAIENFVSNMDERIAEESSSVTVYGEWVDGYRAYTAKNPVNPGALAASVMERYAPPPDYIKRGIHDTGLKNPAADGLQVFSFGDEKKTPAMDIDVEKDSRKYRSKKGQVEYFDKEIGDNLRGESSLNDLDVSAEYGDFINCFSIDGNGINYRATGDANKDKENLEKAKFSIVEAVKYGKNVEFTKFTMDETGMCVAENIPVMHASKAAGKSIDQLAASAREAHVNGPAALKAAKLAQKITERERKKEENLRKDYNKQLQKAEEKSRKKIINDYKKRIKNATSKENKEWIQTDFDDFKKQCKEVDKERKDKEKQRQNQLKAEAKQQKDYIKQLEKEAKQFVKQQKLEAKAREKAEKQNKKQAQADAKAERNREAQERIEKDKQIEEFKKEQEARNKQVQEDKAKQRAELKVETNELIAQEMGAMSDKAVIEDDFVVIDKDNTQVKEFHEKLHDKVTDNRRRITEAERNRLSAAVNNGKSEEKTEFKEAEKSATQEKKL